MFIVSLAPFSRAKWQDKRCTIVEGETLTKKQVCDPVSSADMNKA